jgi:metallo-beta-lactamase family protein
LPVEPKSIHWLALTHAHLNHTGYTPKFVKDGFGGEIGCAAAPRAMLDRLLHHYG